MKINYRKKYEEAQEEANLQRMRAERWLAEATQVRQQNESVHRVLDGTCEKLNKCATERENLTGEVDALAKLNAKLLLKVADLESDAKHDLIVIQTQRDALVRLRKIADLAGKQAEAIWLMSFPWARTWSGAIRVEPYFDVAMSFARDIRTALAAEQVDAQIARKSVAKGKERV